MNITNVRVKITEKDLFTIIEDFLKVPGLKIERINIGELIKVEGHYDTKIKIKFKASLGLGSIKDNVLKLRIFSVSLGVLPIWTRLVNIVLKKILKGFSQMGITMEKNTIFVDFNSLCSYIPYVNFNLKEIITTLNKIEAEVDNLVYKETKKSLSLKELKEKIEAQEKAQEQKEEILPKTKDIYSQIRGRFSNSIVNEIEGRFSNSEENGGRFSKVLLNKRETAAEFIMFLPDILALLCRLMKDDRVKLKTKALIGAGIAYLALPIDIIPEFVPLLGGADDLGIGFLILDKIIDEVPEKIIMQHWSGRDNIILKTKEIKNILFNSIGRKNTIGIISSGISLVKRRKRRK